MTAEKPATRTPLTRERIVCAAVEIIEGQGLPALSMRRLASQLDVEAMSLYNHVAGKEDVLDGVAEFVLGDIRLPDPMPDDWADAVRALARAFRAMALAYPYSCALVLTRQLASPVALHATDTALAVLLSAGFDEATAVHSLRAILAFQVGSLLREVGASPTFGGHDAPGVRARTEELAGSGFPSVCRVAAHLATCDHEAEYDFGLELLLNALRQVHPA